MISAESIQCVFNKRDLLGLGGEEVAQRRRKGAQKKGVGRKEQGH